MKYRLLIILTLGLLVTAGRSAAQQPDGRAHHAAVVVQYASGNVAARCVGFDEASISGYDLLVRAGFGVIAEQNSMGALVCAIDGVGCDYPNESCTCKCQGSECTYWAYSHLSDDVWKYSTVGAKSYQVRDGAVEGWAWGGGSIQNGSTPPIIPWSDVCAAQAAPVATAIPPTDVPTTMPPTDIPATQIPPTKIPATPNVATQIPPSMTSVATQVQPSMTTQPTPSMTVAPTTQPTPSMTVAPTTQPTPSITVAPTATRNPTNTPQPAGIVVTPAVPQSSQTTTNWRNYAIFGGIAAVMAGAIVLVRKRRSRN